MYAFRDWSTHLQIYVLHIFKSDYAHTDSEYTFADSCTHAQIMVRISRFFYTFTHLITHTRIEIQLHNTQICK